MLIEEELNLLKQNCIEIISEEELVKKIQFSRTQKVPLRVKAGFDPTSPDIHLGHSVLLQKLRDFQKCGHQVLFLIGDFTAQIGDPSGQSVTRKQLSFESVCDNAKSYERQIFKVLDSQKTTILYNSTWLSKFSFKEVLSLASQCTVARMLERKDFFDRFQNNQSISIVEFLYPLVQAYDSVELKADIEIGGTDQKFNLLLGRQFQKDYGMKTPQVVMMLPLLKGLDGEKKMSKSFGNAISLDSDPYHMFGQIMSLSDEIMFHFYELLTDLNSQQVHDLKNKIANQMLHPKKAKEDLAKKIVERFYDQILAKESLKEFNNVFKRFFS